MTSATRVAHTDRAAELDLFRLYLDQIGRHPLLTADDEVRLARAYQAGLHARRRLATAANDPGRAELEAAAERGERARRTMIESNLRLVVSIARHYRAGGCRRPGACPSWSGRRPHPPGWPAGPR